MLGRTMQGLAITLCLCLTLVGTAAAEDTIGVLITGWGMPAGFNMEYASTNVLDRIGDRTEFEAQECKIGHVGEFPYQSHFNILPWALTFKTEGYEKYYDSYGIYSLESGVYVGLNPNVPSVMPEDIPDEVPITPLGEVTLRGVLQYPPDPRTGENYVDGYYRIGDYTNGFSNGVHDLTEDYPAVYLRYYGIMTGPTELPESAMPPECIQAMDSYTEELLYESFGDKIDVRFGSYTDIPGYSAHQRDVAREFAEEGFTRLLLARETTDNNNYANNFFTGNTVRESLCEAGVLDDVDIFQTRQVGRTPEFNTLNVMNLKRFIEAYPEGSTIAVIYVTRGLYWDKSEDGGAFGSAHPWSREVYHENAYLNYLSWKKAVIKAYGNRYNLVFTRGGAESDMLVDSLYSYGINERDELGDNFYTIREVMQAVKDDGIANMIIAPCHWQYDNVDTIFRMKDKNGIPLVAKEKLAAGNFDQRYCEDAEGNEVDCTAGDAVADISVASSYSHLPEEFATSYYVVLRGTLERFGLYPDDVWIIEEASEDITKESGGTVAVDQVFSFVNGARIEIPADPYPDRPESFTPETAIATNDPADTNECMWEDSVIHIGHQVFAPPMKSAVPVGPAVHMGPYRTFFNRDVTITIPYYSLFTFGMDVNVYVYNHVTEDWDKIDTATADNGLITFTTQVLGLFQAGIAM